MDISPNLPQKFLDARSRIGIWSVRGGKRNSWLDRWQERRRLERVRQAGRRVPKGSAHQLFHLLLGHCGGSEGSPGQDLGLPR
jgi:hypothetical protein